MKKLMLLWPCLMLTGSLLHGQSLDEVLQQYFNTIGQDKLITVQTMTMKGKTVVMGMENPFMKITKRPGKLRMEADFQGQKMIQAFDGEKGWVIAPWTGTSDPQELPAEQVKLLKWQAEMDGFLYNYKEKGLTTELIGKEEMEGTEVFKIKQTNQDGDVFIYYIDAGNYMILKTEFNTKILGNEIKLEGYKSNFKEVEGIVFPFNIENRTQGLMANQVVVVDTIILNQEVSDSVFIMPARKVPEAKPQ